MKSSPGEWHLTEVANATTATHLARSRGSRHTPKFCAHLLESRSPPAAPTQCTFAVIAARKKMCGKSHIVRGLHLQFLLEVRGGHRTCRRPVRTAESTSPRSLDMISKRNKATHGRPTDEVCRERKPVRFSGIMQNKNSINSWRSSVTSCPRPQDVVLLVELNLSQVDFQ